MAGGIKNTQRDDAFDSTNLFLKVNPKEIIRDAGKYLLQQILITASYIIRKN